MSDVLATLPADTTDQRSHAAALWKSISASPDDIRREREQLQGEIGHWRGLARNGEAAVAQLRQDLQSSKEAGVAPLVVACLIALLIVAPGMACVLWFKTRGRDGTPPARRNAWDDAFDNAAPLPASPPAARQVQALPAGADGDAHVKTAQHQTPAIAPSGFGPSQFASVPPQQVQELEDIQHHVDFFLALGDADRAIDLLKAHIAANPRSSVLAWLDLLDIYYKQQLREAYEALRWDIVRLFHANVPPFEDYEENGPGLEADEAALSRLVALWPSPKVLDVIEEAILRNPGDDGALAFDLSAYRDLLLLYNIGREVIRGEEVNSGFKHPSDAPPDSETPADSPLTTMQPLLPDLASASARSAPSNAPGKGQTGPIDFEF